MATERTSSNVEPITALANRWYNCVIGELHLDPTLFQLRLPAALIESDETLWVNQDVIPPAALSLNSSVRDDIRFSHDYMAVIDQLQYPENQFRQDIGDDVYRRWSSYLSMVTPRPSENRVPMLFRQWSSLNAPAVMSVGFTDLSQAILINSMRNRLLPYRGPNPKSIDFSGTAAELSEILRNSSAASFSFASSSTSDDISDAWASGYDNGLYGIWSGGRGTSRLNRKFASSSITAKVDFMSYTVWASTPGAWYDSSALNLAYGSKATPPWPTNANPSWDEVFGGDGSIQRLVGSLLVVDGIKAVVTSKTNYCEIDQQIIRDNAFKGLWPFYIANDGNKVDNFVMFDTAEGMTFEITTGAENPIVIGDNVLTIGRYLGHAVD